MIEHIPAPGVPVPLTRRELREAWNVYNVVRRYQHATDAERRDMPEAAAGAGLTVTYGAITLDLARYGVSVTLKARNKTATELLLNTAPADWVAKDEIVCGSWTVTDAERCTAMVTN